MALAGAGTPHFSANGRSASFGLPTNQSPGKPVKKIYSYRMSLLPFKILPVVENSHFQSFQFSGKQQPQNKVSRIRGRTLFLHFVSKNQGQREKNQTGGISQDNCCNGSAIALQDMIINSMVNDMVIHYMKITNGVLS